MSNANRKPTGMKLVVTVTQDIIDHGVARDSTHCIFADAIKASFPGAARVSVDLATMRFTDLEKRLRYTYLTPRMVQQALVQFDQGVKPEPLQFQLRGAHVTRAGNSDAKRVLTEKQKKSIAKMAPEKIKKMHDVLKRSGLRATKGVAERTGGKTPPTQKGKDGVPFSRRRAFGIRALIL